MNEELFIKRLMKFCNAKMIEQNKTKQDCANYCHVDYHTVRNWLTCNATPSIASAIRLLNYLGYELTVQRIVTNRENK